MSVLQELLIVTMNPTARQVLHQAVTLHALHLSDSSVLVTYCAELCSRSLLLYYILYKGLHGINGVL